MINTINHLFNIDMVNDVDLNQVINIKKNDTKSHKFIINFFNDSVAYSLTGLSAKIYFHKSDDTNVFQNCDIDNAANGIVSCILSSQTLSCAGIVNAEITLYGTEDEVLTSKTFAFNVIDSVRDDNAIESTNEFSALTDALATAGNFTNIQKEIEDSRQGFSTLGGNLKNKDSRMADMVNQINAINQNEAIKTPPGQIGMFFRQTAPTGWLELNGQWVSQTTYASLYAVIYPQTLDAANHPGMFQLPDLETERRFIRPANQTYPVGTIQEDAFKKHRHRLAVFGSSGTASYANLCNGTTTQAMNYIDQVGAFPFVEDTGDKEETRPKNIAALICIKF